MSAHHERRSRSTTAISQRPLSRDSTASLQSTAPRSVAQYSSNGNHPYAPQLHMASPQSQSQAQAQAQAQAQNFELLQSMAQQQYPPHGLPLDHSQQQHFHPQVQNQASMYHSHSIQSFGNNNNQQHTLDQLSGTMQQQPGMATLHHHQATPDTEETRKKGNGSAATQSNEKELRESLDRNKHRSLQDVAKEVVDSERTSRAEKTKQLFAMIWLNNSCETAKTSVPRGRVYGSYADRCATEKVAPLNPASFGKLVRIIFKGIQTRRLGVRGESKYHYVDLALKSERDQNEPSNRNMAGQDLHSPSSMAIDFNNMPILSANTDYAFDGSPLASPVLAPRPDLGQADGAVFADPTRPQYRSPFPFSQTYPQQLRFPSADDEDVLTADVELPDLWPYAPENTDEDAAHALKSLYRSHCTSLIEYFKKCKEKQFWRTFTSLQGTLTVPVQKLLTSPSMAAWIRECDYYMYKRMLTYISRIALEVLPHTVLNFFNSISLNLHPNIVRTFSGMPHHVLEARLEPAARFAELLSRMMKVNNSAHAASQVLENDDGRSQLHQEWMQLVNPKRIMEGELPGCGYEETYKILTEDMAALLRPLTAPLVDHNGLPYAPDQPQENVENYIERIDILLRSLPSRFPQASARTIVSCVKNLSTAAMREFTMQSAQSFHAWWIVKVFIDEYSQWLVTSGGFMAHRPTRRSQSSPTGGSIHNGAVESEERSADPSRVNSMASAEGDNNASLPTASDPSRKRRSDAGDDTDKTTKRQRTTPELADAPNFEHNHPSFATTSFGSAHLPNDSTELPDFDDSGLGLGLVGNSSPPGGVGQGKRIDRAPLMQHFGDVESTAIAI